jgi:hypothetical protein
MRRQTSNKFPTFWLGKNGNKPRSLKRTRNQDPESGDTKGMLFVAWLLTSTLIELPSFVVPVSDLWPPSAS